MNTAKRIVETSARAVLQVNPLNGADKIKVRIDAAQVVSFDIFDTLLKRDVLHPSDVLVAVQMRYEAEKGPLGIDFRQCRLKAESEAYAVVGNGETSLEDIYARIALPDNVKRSLLELELDTEFLLSVGNEAVRPLYNYALNEGKRVVLVSDMYLPRKLIEKLLGKAGFAGYERIFLSSEEGFRKRSGELFPRVAVELEVKPGDILHIGDSIKPDYYQAHAAGMEAVLIPRHAYVQARAVSFSNGSSLEKSIFLAAQRNLSSGKGYYYRFGVEALGPLLWGLSYFVREEMQRRGQSAIYFMARDGYVLKQAFELIFPDIAACSRYLYASRRSIGVPSIYTVEDLAEVGPTTRLIAVEDWLRAVGVNDNAAGSIVLKAGFTAGERITKLECMDDPRFKKLCELALPLVKNQAACQRNLLADYLRSQKVNGGSAVFDLGWAGNVQGFLNRVLRNELGISEGVFGYYLGLDKAKFRGDIDCEAFLGFKHPSLYLGLVELCFSAPEGTCRGFTRGEDGIVVPVTAPYEYEGLREAGFVAEIQRGALDLVKKLCELRTVVDIHLDSDTAFNVLEQVGSNPNAEDLEAFALFRFEDNGVYAPLADPAPMHEYLLRPKRFKLDFASSRWKVGFAKEIFKVPLPYYCILSSLKSIQRKRSMKERHD